MSPHGHYGARPVSPAHDAHDEKIKLQCRCLLHPQAFKPKQRQHLHTVNTEGLVGHGESLGGR